MRGGGQISGFCHFSAIFLAIFLRRASKAAGAGARMSRQSLAIARRQATFCRPKCIRIPADPKFTLFRPRSAQVSARSIDKRDAQPLGAARQGCDTVLPGHTGAGQHAHVDANNHQATQPCCRWPN